MAIFAATISFTLNAPDDDSASEVAKQIIEAARGEVDDLTEASVVDIEMLEEDVEPLDFEEDDE